MQYRKKGAMKHRILTCKNHPELRWSCKEVAWTEHADGTGGYNGCRNIFFNGVSTGEMFEDKSGVKCTHVVDGEWVQECECSARDLIIAPEDALVADR